MSKKEKIVFICLSVFLLLPNILGFLIAKDLSSFMMRVVYLISAVLFYGAGLTFFKRKTFFYVGIVSFLISAVELVHLIMNGATMSLLFVYTCMKSYLAEFLELASTYWFVGVIFISIWGVYIWLNTRFIRNEFIAPARWRLVAAGGIILWFSLIGSFLHAQRNDNLVSSQGDDLRTTALVGAEKFSPNNAILSVFHITHLYEEIHAQQKPLKDFRFGTTCTSKRDEIAVLLIGETSRYKNWQINGYERETSPCLMARQDNLISFDSCYTICNLTTVCVPYMLSRATPQNPRLYYQEKSIVEAFQEAGYKTAWIADQSFNNPFLQRISHTCDYNYYVPHGGPKRDYMDTVLWEPFEKALRMPGKKFIVVHSLGCHFKYSGRYPAEYQRFTPDMNGINMREMLRSVDINTDGIIDVNEESLPVINNLRHVLVNSYDNAILFTDHFMDGIISRLEQTGQPCTFVYVGDHGENLLDDERNMFMHGTFSGSEYEFHVPLFVWMSDRYKTLYPDKWEAAKANKSRQISTMNLFHSFLDMGHLKYDLFEPDKDIFGTNLVPDSIAYGLDANLQLTQLPK